MIYYCFLTFPQVNLCGTTSIVSVRNAVSDSITRVRPGLIKSLLAGSCGRFYRASLGDVATLLHALLSSLRLDNDDTTNKSLLLLTTTLHQDYFVAGDAARMAAVKFLSGCATTGAVTVDRLAHFLDDLWLLHQTDNAEAVIVQSDAALNFVRSYGETPPTTMM